MPVDGIITNMKVTILGTGTFYVNKERSGPAYLIDADGKKILIDCGPGTLIRLSEIGLKPEDIDYIFISHFHADHTTDLFAFQMNFRIYEFYCDGKEYKTPIIFGPSGIEDFTKKLSYIYELPAFDNYDKIKYKKHQDSLRLGNILVKTFNVEHTAFGVSAKAFAFRFELGGKSIAFSGDSVKCQGLSDVCKDVDIFICDTSNAKGYGSPAHLDTLEIGEIAQASAVKKLVLTHFYPKTDDIDLVAEVKENYSGPVVHGEDFMEIEV